ncbi:hypothetical protein V499_00570 [Pseudogymnoascus sp. VKM F-103]|nr:hypothetical protein V499_00570 [Pseudogymnoascus sp. VKM F-103]
MSAAVPSATAPSEQCHNESIKALAMKQFRGMSQSCCLEFPLGAGDRVQDAWANSWSSSEVPQRRWRSIGEPQVESAKVVLALSHPEPPAAGRPAGQLIVDANKKCEPVGLAAHEARGLELQTHSLKNRAGRRHLQEQSLTRTRVSDSSAYKASMAAQEI